MNQTNKRVQLVPIVKIPPPDDTVWALAINSVQKPFVPLLIPNPLVEKHLAINEALWIVALHWVFRKKWCKRHKIPANRAATKAVEPLGELLFRILELCIQCHAVLPAGSNPYGNAAVWFDLIVWETKRGDFAEILSPHESGQGKNKHARKIWKDVKSLKEDWENPNAPESDPHTHK
jgi:hypothetical protein